MASRERRIGVYILSGPGYFAHVFSGVSAFCRTQPRWTIMYWPHMTFPPESQIRQAVADGAIDGVIGLGWKLWESMVARGRLQAVNIEYNEAPVASLPRVGVDERAIGQLAAHHFRERGLQHLAALGRKGALPATERLAAFVDAARTWCSEPVQCLDLADEVRQEDLRRFLIALPRPTGLFCWHDEAAKHVYPACKILRLRIPEDLAILGVDNDEALCDAFDPPLSSIDANAYRVGYEAAALLERLMDGQPIPTEPLIVPPVGLVTRKSTDMLAIDAPDVVEAVRYIRQHADALLRVQDVVDRLAISRSSLERQFHQALGRTPASEIRRVLVEQARNLLVHTDLPIQAVAARCGYPHANHFTVMFRKQTGQTPTAYRQQTRLM